MKYEVTKTKTGLFVARAALKILLAPKIPVSSK